MSPLEWNTLYCVFNNYPHKNLAGKDKPKRNEEGITLAIFLNKKLQDSAMFGLVLMTYL